VRVLLYYKGSLCTEFTVTIVDDAFANSSLNDLGEVCNLYAPFLRKPYIALPRVVSDPGPYYIPDENTDSLTYVPLGHKSRSTQSLDTALPRGLVWHIGSIFSAYTYLIRAG